MEECPILELAASNLPSGLGPEAQSGKKGSDASAGMVCRLLVHTGDVRSYRSRLFMSKAMGLVSRGGSGISSGHENMGVP